jgi:hypothetical protein
MQIYFVLRNFRTHEVKRPGGETRYVVRLASSFVIVEDDEPHKVVRKGTFVGDRPEGADESRTPRHDYFVNYEFPVPDLPPGPYNLVIQVEDRGSNPPRTIQGKPLYFYVTNPNLPAPDTGRGID